MAVAARALHELFLSDPARADVTMMASVPWLHWLPDGERRICIEQLIAGLDAGAATGNLEPFARALLAWKSTAEVWSDPELARRLTAALCQWPTCSAQWRPAEVPAGGRADRPLAQPEEP